MTGLVRKATLLCVGGALLAGAAIAGVPNSTNSTISGSSMALGTGCITISDYPSMASCIPLVIRDANNNAVPGASVVLDFSTCPTGDVKICSTQNPQGTTLASAPTQPASAICGPSYTVTVAADALGQVCVIPKGGTNLPFGHTPTAGSRPTCCRIYADSQLLTTVVVTVSAYDLNGSGTVTGGDLGVWLGSYLGASPTYRSKGDYNCTGTVTGGDLGQWLAGLGAYSGNTSLFGCTSFCP